MGWLYAKDSKFVGEIVSRLFASGWTLGSVTAASGQPCPGLFKDGKLATFDEWETESRRVGIEVAKDFPELARNLDEIP